jgi:hypothetical protein
MGPNPRHHDASFMGASIHYMSYANRPGSAAKPRETENFSFHRPNKPYLIEIPRVPCDQISGCGQVDKLSPCIGRICDNWHRTGVRNAANCNLSKILSRKSDPIEIKNINTRESIYLIR